MQRFGNPTLSFYEMYDSTNWLRNFPRNIFVAAILRELHRNYVVDVIVCEKFRRI